MVDTWGSDRDGGARSHQGTDIFAGRGTAVLSPEDGTLEVADGARAGVARRVRSRDGQRVWLLAHLEPGAAAPGEVSEGALIGRVGSSGNAEGLCPHVHVELRVAGRAVNPYPLLEQLRAAERRGELERARADVERAAEALRQVASAWESSGIPEARTAAVTMRDVTEAAVRTAAHRPDVAREGLRQLLVIAEDAPASWRTPGDLLERARRLLEETRDATASPATGAGIGLGVGVVVALLALGWYLMRGR